MSAIPPATTLHLGMIVRNEAEMLARTVPIYAPFFTHKWALDTGSTDGTIDLLRDHGFTVICTEWRNDYAWARNTLLEMKRIALGGGPGVDLHVIPSIHWLLYLDADECMWPADLLKLTEACTHTTADVITLPRINLAARATLQEVGSWPDKQARCLRLCAPLEHALPVHEVVRYVGHSTSVTGEGRDYFADAAPIFHYGWCKPPQACWLRSHNYTLIVQGREPINTVPNDIAAVTEDAFLRDLSTRHKLAPWSGPHPLEGRL